MYIARVSKPGYNAHTTQTANLFFYETYPAIKILKQVGISEDTTLYNPGLGNKSFGVFAFDEFNNELFMNDSCYDDSGFRRNFSYFIVFNESYQRQLAFTIGNYFYVPNPKRLIFYTIDSNFESNEDFKFLIHDETGTKKILSSEFDHLKEYQSGSVSLTISVDELYDPAIGPVFKKSFVSVPHNLGYRPLCLAYAKQTSFYSNTYFDDEHQTFFSLPKPYSYALWTSFLSSSRSIYYGITNNAINFYTTISSSDFFIIGERIKATMTYEIYYKIFYNDIDETFSYV